MTNQIELTPEQRERAKEQLRKFMDCTGGFADTVLFAVLAAINEPPKPSLVEECAEALGYGLSHPFPPVRWDDLTNEQRSAHRHAALAVLRTAKAGAGDRMRAFAKALEGYDMDELADAVFPGVSDE